MDCSKASKKHPAEDVAGCCCGMLHGAKCYAAQVVPTLSEPLFALS